MGKIDLEIKRENEKKIVAQMISIFCKKKHGARGKELCAECRKLLNYAHKRSDACPFVENKTFCSNCSVHCYKLEMRERIRDVMRFSGVRMIFSHPIMVINHLVAIKREKANLSPYYNRK